MMLLHHFLAVAAALAVGAGCVHKTTSAATRPVLELPKSADSVEPVRARPIKQAIVDGVQFIIADQNADGSWGTGLQTRGYEIYNMVPGSQDAFRVATTALCVLALREAEDAGVAVKAVSDTRAKGVEYLITHEGAKRDNGELLYNTWACIYTLQAMVVEMRTSPDPRLKATADRALRQMTSYENNVGGWNYYDFQAHTQKPSLGATVFGTSAGVVALREAHETGLELPQPMIDRALRRIKESRRPDGSYLYGSDYQYAPNLPANQLRGSLGRIQAANYAQWVWNMPGMNDAIARDGFDIFVRDHEWLNMGRKRPMPHEAWYQNSGYYYYFGHYYASRLIGLLPEADRPQRYAALASFVLPYQEEDGSWWDYAMWDYHKPYGTAYAVMTLLRCVPANE